MFKYKPLNNIHAVLVSAEFKGLNLIQKALLYIKTMATQKVCYNVTLAVLKGYQITKNAYVRCSFASDVLDIKVSKVLFWERAL